MSWRDACWRRPVRLGLRLGRLQFWCRVMSVPLEDVVEVLKKLSRDVRGGSPPCVRTNGRGMLREDIMLMLRLISGRHALSATADVPLAPLRPPRPARPQSWMSAHLSTATASFLRCNS